MLNKIHNNLKSMLIEVRQIVGRNQSHSFKASQDNGLDIPLDRSTIPPISFKIKPERNTIVPDEGSTRAKTHLSTQSQSLTSMSKKRSINERNPKSFKGSLYTKELSSLLPVESELLSTRFYGLYKKKIQTKTLQNDLLPEIRSKKKGVRAASDWLRQSIDRNKETEKINKIKQRQNLFAAKPEGQKRQKSMIQRAKKRKNLLKDWVKQQNQKKQKIKTNGQDNRLEPWQSIQIDLEYLEQ